VHALRSAGFAAERVPLSGSAGGSYAGDILVKLLSVGLRVEAKARGNGFGRLYRWLAGADLLIVKQDRAEPLVIVPLTLAIESARIAENSRISGFGAPDALPPGKLVKQKSEQYNE
jgi:Holliday junction resolvase